MYKSIGYATRDAKTGDKICAGSFGGSFDVETANRLIKSHFSVLIKPSGRAVFVDKKGREVVLSITVNAEITEAGKNALALWMKEKRARDEAETLEEEKRKIELDNLLDGMSHAEAIARLSEKCA